MKKLKKRVIAYKVVAVDNQLRRVSWMNRTGQVVYLAPRVVTPAAGNGPLMLYESYPIAKRMLDTYGVPGDEIWECEVEEYRLPPDATVAAWTAGRKLPIDRLHPHTVLASKVRLLHPVYVKRPGGTNQYTA